MCSCSLVQSSSLIEPMIEGVLPFFTMPAGGGEGDEPERKMANAEKILICSVCVHFYTYKRLIV